MTTDIYCLDCGATPSGRHAEECRHFSGVVSMPFSEACKCYTTWAKQQRQQHDGRRLPRPSKAESFEDDVAWHLCNSNGPLAIVFHDGKVTRWQEDILNIINWVKDCGELRDDGLSYSFAARFLGATGFGIEWRDLSKEADGASELTIWLYGDDEDEDWLEPHFTIFVRNNEIENVLESFESGPKESPTDYSTALELVAFADFVWRILLQRGMRASTGQD